MGKRKIKHRFSKQQRHMQEQKITAMSEAITLRQNTRDKAIKDVYEAILPLFILYLMDNFRCKKKGILKFMDWFNATSEWIDGDPARIEEIKKELWERAEVGIEY